MNSIPKRINLCRLNNRPNFIKFAQKKYLDRLPQRDYDRLSKVLFNEKIEKIDPFEMVKPEMDSFSKNIIKIISNENETLAKVACHVMGHTGKNIRPVVNILIAKALRPENKSILNFDFSTSIGRQLRLAEVTELIHTGSLLHDDVIDQADFRRSAPSVRSRFGNKVAILGGDYFLAKASAHLAKLSSTRAVGLIAEAIESLVSGEVTDVEYGETFELKRMLEEYCFKNYLKTAALFADSCEAVAELGGVGEKEMAAARGYGETLGLAFQVVDDILDVESTGKTLGKPVQNDLKNGLVTAPLIFAIESDRKLFALSQTNSTDNLKLTSSAMTQKKVLRKSRDLAEQFALRAIRWAEQFPESPYRQALIALVLNSLKRSF